MVTESAKQQMVRAFKALSDPTRVSIIGHLSDGPRCVGVLAEALGVTHSAVSQHLRILREAGLVESERRGCRVHYALSRRAVGKTLTQIEGWLGPLAAASEGTASRKPTCKRTSARRPKSRR